jgi:hypothetical protein
MLSPSLNTVSAADPFFVFLWQPHFFLGGTGREVICGVRFGLVLGRCGWCLVVSSGWWFGPQRRGLYLFRVYKEETRGRLSFASLHSYSFSAHVFILSVLPVLLRDSGQYDIRRPRRASPSRGITRPSRYRFSLSHHRHLTRRRHHRIPRGDCAGVRFAH